MRFSSPTSRASSSRAFSSDFIASALYWLYALSWLLPMILVRWLVISLSSTCRRSNSFISAVFFELYSFVRASSLASKSALRSTLSVSNFC